MAGHDWQFWGVMDAVQEFADVHGIRVHVTTQDRLTSWYFLKCVDFKAPEKWQLGSEGDMEVCCASVALVLCECFVVAVSGNCSALCNRWFSGTPFLVGPVADVRKEFCRGLRKGEKRTRVAPRCARGLRTTRCAHGAHDLVHVVL